MSWIILIVAGALEAVWATALGLSEGLKRVVPTAVFVVTCAVSLWLLAVAMREIPTGTAYAVWVGIGASLTVVVAILRGSEAVNLLKVAMLTLLIACVVGLKVVA